MVCVIDSPVRLHGKVCCPGVFRGHCQRGTATLVTSTSFRPWWVQSIDNRLKLIMVDIARYPLDYIYILKL